MPNLGQTKGLAARFSLAVTLIFELFCVAGMVFMIRFLIALFKDGRAKSQCHVVF